MNVESTQTMLKPENGNPQFAQLHEVALPDSISWLPLTSGWSFLLFVLFCYVMFLFYKRFKRHIANAYRRTALVILEQLNNEPDDLEKIPQLIRRTALYAFPREMVAPKVGREWEVWLDEQCKNSKFSTQFQGVLQKLAYSPETKLSQSEFVELKQCIALWIKKHERQYD